MILYIFDGCKRHFVAVVLELKELLGFTVCFHFGPFEMKIDSCMFTKAFWVMETFLMISRLNVEVSMAMKTCGVKGW